MEKILFVDDEMLVLKGFRRALRHRRDEWAFEYAMSADEALTLMQEFAATVVVSDMRMPDRDGASFLTEVMQLYPSTIRFVLSGAADIEAIMRSVGPSHQYLSKPCDSRDLERAIDRTRRIKALIESKTLTELVAGVGELPSLPETYRKLRAALQDPETQVDSIAQIVATDIAMTVKVLKLVNSAYFGLARRVTDIGEAVSYLGLETITSLTLGHGAFGALACAEADTRALESLSNSALKTASFARAIARAEKIDNRTINDTFLASMLGYLGDMLIASKMPTVYANVVSALSESRDESPTTIQERISGARFDELGAYLISLWNLPDTVVEAVAFRQCPAASPVHEVNAVAISHIAYCLVHSGQSGQPIDRFVDHAFMDGLTFKGDWASWRALCDGMTEEAA